MKIVVTADKMLDRGVWDKFCKLRGINPWAINEGLMQSSDEFTLTEDEARKLGFIRD